MMKTEAIERCIDKLGKSPGYEEIIGPAYDELAQLQADSAKLEKVRAEVREWLSDPYPKWDSLGYMTKIRAILGEQT